MTNLALQDSEQESCRHCGQSIVGEPTVREGLDGVFCCGGCAFVYGSISSLGLTRYYCIPQWSGKRSEVRPDETFAYFDDPLFVERFTAPVKTNSAGDSSSIGELREVTLFLEGVHCAACVWLLEKLPTVVAGIVTSRLAFAESKLTVVYEPTRITLSTIATVLNSLGYTATPLQEGDERRAQRGADRRMLLRLGVAGFATMNIMMMAVSLYQGESSGIEDHYRDLFSWVSLALFLPVLLFSAVPFFRTAVGGLRGGMLHIDLPISLAIVVGSIASAVNIVLGRPHYLDSLAALVFLLLAGRWLQQQTLRRAGDARALQATLVPRRARRAGGVEVYVESLVPGDEIQVIAGETIPVDGAVVAGDAMVATAILTGESAPHAVSPGTIVYAGSTVSSGELLLRTARVGAHTRLGKIVAQVHNASAARSPVELFLDRLSRRFTAVVLIMSLFTFLFWIPSGAVAAFDNTLALLIVTCPCVVALATPLTFSLAVQSAAEQGMLFRSVRPLELLMRSTEMFFDKTGTLTDAQMSVRRVFLSRSDGSVEHELSKHEFIESYPHLVSVLTGAEHGVEHPIAHALCSLGAGMSPAAISDRVIHPGGGISFTSDGARYRLGSLRFVSDGAAVELSSVDPRLEQARVFLTKDSRLLLAIALSDGLRPEAREIVRGLQRDGRRCSLLSGDTRTAVQLVGAELGIPVERRFAEHSPEEKARRVLASRGSSESEEISVMIGDGVNDAAALSAAQVGIGVRGGAEATFAVADLFLSRGIEQLPAAMRLSALTMRTVRLNLAVATAYNIIGGAGTILGIIGPLHAAILMPLSSLTTVGVALWRRPRGRNTAHQRLPRPPTSPAVLHHRR